SVFFYSRDESDRDWKVRIGGDSGGVAQRTSQGAEPRVEFLPGHTLHVRGRRSLFFHWNPAIRSRLARGRYDVVVIPGWSMPTSVAAALACRTRGIPYVLFSETHDRSPRPAW